MGFPGSGARALGFRLAAAAVATSLALLIGIHLPPVRSLVRDRALDWLRTSMGAQVSVDRLSYNLLTLDFRLQGVTASAPGANAPFLTAKDVRVNLPWSAALGTFRVENLEVNGLALSIVRSADGSLNLPTFEGGGGGGPPRVDAAPARVDIERVSIRQTSLHYEDRSNRLSADAEGLALDLVPGAGGVSSGRLTTRGGLLVRVGDQAVAGALDGSLAYDGTALILTDLRYVSSLGWLNLGGRLGVLGPSPTASLTVGASVALEPVCTALALEPKALGTIELTGQIDGALASPTATLSVTSDSVRWRHLAATSLAARATATTEALTLESLALTFADGTAAVRGRLLFELLKTTAHVEWSNVAAAQLAGPYTSAPIAARLSGHAEIDGSLAGGLSGLDLTADLRADGRQAGARSIGVDGNLSLTLARGEWRMRVAHDLSRAIRIEGDLAGRLNDAIADSSIGGAITASAASPSRLIQLLRNAGTTPPDWIQPEAGRLEAKLRLGGTLGSPEVSGRVELLDVRVAGSQPLTAELPFAASLDHIRVDGAKAVIGGNVLMGSGTLDLAGGELRGGFDVDLSDFAAFGNMVTAWRPSGHMSARIELTGTQTRPTVHATVSGSALRAAGQELGELSAELAYSNSILSAPSFALRQPGGGRLVASGDYALGSGRQTLALRADALRLSPVEADAGSWPVAAVVNGSLDANGTIEHPEGGGHLALTDLHWEAVHADRADVDVALSDDGVRAAASIPSLGLLLNAALEPRAPYRLTLDAAAEDTQIVALLDALGVVVPPELGHLTGSVSARMKGAGTAEDLADLTADATIERVDLQAGDASLSLERPATAHYSASALTVDQLRLRTGATTCEVTGEVGPSSPNGLAVSLNGALADLRPWALAAGLPADLALDGAVAATVRASGALDRLALTGDLKLEQGRIAWPGYPAASDVAAHVTIANESIDMPTLTARWQDVTAAGRLSVPLGLLAEWLPASLVAGLSRQGGVAVFQGQVDNLTPAALVPFAGDAILDLLKGRTSLHIDLQADGPALNRVSGSLLMNELSLTAVGLPVEQMRPTRVEIAAGSLHVADWAWTVAGSQISLAGEANLAGGGALDLHLGGRLDLRILSLFMPTVTTAGTGDLSVSIGGTMAEPVADGTVRLDAGELRLVEPPIGVSNASGLVVLRGNRVEISRLEGELNGGRFSILGGIEYRGFALTGGSLSMHAPGVALNFPEGMHTEVNAGLAIDFGDRVQVTGRVDVVRGAYREPLSLAAALAAYARQRDGSRASTDATSLLERIDLNIVVASAEDLSLDNNYGRMDLGLDLRLAGTAAAPAVIGRATVREGGLLFLSGRTYLIERGLIDFSNPRAIVPELDISARTRVQGTDETGAPTEYDVTLTVTGTPDTLETTLSSNPSRGQADIVSLLATGKLADQMGGAGGAMAREQLLGVLSGETLGFAAHAIGLDAIRFERSAGAEALQSDPSIAGEVNPAQRLTISRRISGRAEVTVSQNLRDTGRLTWIVAYTPWRAVEVRTVSLDDRSRSYEVRHDVAFGGPPTPQAPRPGGGARVSAVRFAGELEVAAAELERMLGLKAGDRFDFYRWQQDRDRLRRFYLDRRYREVRISARQVPQPDADGGPGVVLQYDVQAGPETALDVVGYRLPTAVVRDLERVWSNAVVEIALLDDLRSAVRKYMAEQGYLRADVRVARMPPSSPPGAKRIRVQIEPGPLSASRSVQATGNARLSTAEIDAAAAQLGIDIWLAPRILADEIALQYREKGLLAAAVTAGPANLDEPAAVLPVRISEGPQFTIGRVVVEGARARAEVTVRKDLGLTQGADYAPDAVQRARAAMASAYARDGFTHMTDEVETTVDRTAGTVAVTIRIDEGLRQVLESVAVAGARGVNAGVVDDALDLSPGSPVDMAAWYAARRRLFQTGLFSRVDIESTPIPTTSQTPGVEYVRADVTVVRRAPWRLRYGADVTDQNAPLAEQGRVFGGGLNANLERQGLFGRPGSSVASMRYNNSQRIARGLLTWPSLFGRPVASRLYLSRSRDLVQGAGILSFITDKTVVTGEQRLNIWAHAQIAYAYQFERNHVFDPVANPNDPFALDERWRQARLTSSLIIDTRSDPFEPKRGQLHSSNVEYGLEVLGRNGRFLKYSLQQLLFAEVAPGVVSASGVRVNLGKGLGQDLILSERFYAGGANTVRGYAEDSLGGFDAFGDPIPGQAAAVLNQEIRFPIFRWVRGAAFIDAGNVFSRAADLSLRTLKVGTGGGVRFSTPLGLFRLDLAAPVPRNGQPLKWSFAFGHIF